jgi:hypothetical protein
MPDREHFAFPFQIGSDGQILTVEQDSDAEIEGCMATGLSWPLGTRDLNPDFGIDEQAFLQDGADLEEIRTALTVSEPRAIPLLEADDTLLDRMVQTVRTRYARTEGVSPE